MCLPLKGSSLSCFSSSSSDFCQSWQGGSPAGSERPAARLNVGDEREVLPSLDTVWTELHAWSLYFLTPSPFCRLSWLRLLSQSEQTTGRSETF